jgi:hypothetical protein
MSLPKPRAVYRKLALDPNLPVKRRVHALRSHRPSQATLVKLLRDPSPVLRHEAIKAYEVWIARKELRRG